MLLVLNRRLRIMTIKVQDKGNPNIYKFIEILISF